MKKSISFLRVGILVGITLLLLGCGQKQEPSEEESPSGASFKIGKGVMLISETSKILDVKTADATEERLPQVIELNAQIFSDGHRFEELNMGHTEYDMHAAGFLPADKAALVKPKQKVSISNSNNESFDGFVAAVQKTFSHGETEIIIGIAAAENRIKDGEFVKASISMLRDELVITIPISALLRTIEGTFVYVVNGDAYLRTPVKVGSANKNKIEIVEGLYSGDQVVTNPVETLWLIELRVTKGGGHCH